MPAQRNPGITGLVLAGGQARRMAGVDKGLLDIGGLTMVERITDCLEKQCDAILINANRNIPEYEQFGYPVVTDVLENYQGPLSGMLSGLKRTSTEWIITAPCDGPFLSAEYTRRMQQAAKSEGTCLAVALGSGRLQPVYAFLHYSLVPSLEAYLDLGERKIDRWMKLHDMTVVDFTDEPDMFENINTPDELEACKTRLASTRG